MSYSDIILQLPVPFRKPHIFLRQYKGSRALFGMCLIVASMFAQSKIVWLIFYFWASYRIEFSSISNIYINSVCSVFNFISRSMCNEESVLRVKCTYKPMKTTTSTLFQYGGLKPNVDCTLWNKNLPVHSFTLQKKPMTNCNTLKPHLRPTGIAATTALLAAIQTVREG